LPASRSHSFPEHIFFIFNSTHRVLLLGSPCSLNLSSEKLLLTSQMMVVTSYKQSENNLS
jgi:hypothetical protein